MPYAYDASLIDRVKPRISQWEATTGRRIHPTVLDSLIREQLRMEGERATKERAYDLEKQKMDKEEKAAKTKGIIDVASTGIQAGLTYKALSKPSAVKELMAYNKANTYVKPNGCRNCRRCMTTRERARPPRGSVYWQRVNAKRSRVSP